MLNSLDISRSALIAQRERMNVIAGNVAMAGMPMPVDDNGEVIPFHRRSIEFFAQSGMTNREGRVDFKVKIDKSTPSSARHQPGDHNADKDGFVHYSGINLQNEMTDGLLASRAYEANLTAVQITRQMAYMTLQLLK